MRDTMDAYYLRRIQKPRCCIDSIHSKYNSLNINTIQETLESKNSTRFPGEDDKKYQACINEHSPSKHQNVFPNVPVCCNFTSDFVSLHSTRYQQKINIGKAEKLKKE